MSIALPELKQMLQANAEALARALLPHGKRNGRWWLACNPRRDDKHPSFGVGISGDAPGAWKDFASGDAGDVLGLIAYVNGFPSIGKGATKDDVRPTLEWAKAFLGIDGAAPPAVAQRVAQAKDDANKRTAAEAAEAEKNARRAKAIYLDSHKLAFLESPADLYLQGRGIDVKQLSRLPGALGWLPDQLHIETQTRWPVMVAGISDEAGHIIAVHRTFLGRERSAGVWTKAPVTPVRKVWPRMKGGTIRLWRGKSGLSISAAQTRFEKTGECETLVLVEGVEDALSVALACPDYRVWAAIALGNLAELKIPPCCDQVVICADNDWGKPQAEKAFRAAVKAIAAQGASVRVGRSTVGKDVNDALRG